MLRNLVINNFALIKNLEIEFKDKLNVISGETGSGKSLILKALKFVLGDRSDKSFIRNGENFAKVQCLFDDLSDDVISLCADLGISVDESKTLIISRLINVDGKSDIRINGSLCTLSVLNSITEKLVDFYGQQEHFSLLNSSKQIDVVDGFAGKSLYDLKQKLKELIVVKNEIEQKLATNYGNEDEKKHKLELLQFEISELEDGNFDDEYESGLKDKKQKIQSFEKIRSAVDTIKNILSNGYSNSSLSNAMKEISQNLRSIEKFESAVADLQEFCDNIRYDLEDFDSRIEDLSDSVFVDDLNIDEIEQELDRVKKLARKYGDTFEKRVAYLNNIKEEFDFINNNEQMIAKFTENLSKVNNEILDVCSKIYKLREDAIKQIEVGILSNLKDLDMKNCKFEISHNLSDDLKDLTYNGLDTLEFMFSSNLGQPVKSLKRIISGGELSRFMLAYKNVIMQKDEIDLLIFDEIDAGISGIVGQKVACKICDISNICQIISISHLPQIVSMADNNYRVFKTIVGNETETMLEEVAGNDLLKEIARLSGSKEIKDLDLNYAGELRQYNEDYKNTHRN